MIFRKFVTVKKLKLTMCVIITFLLIVSMLNILSIIARHSTFEFSEIDDTIDTEIDDDASPQVAKNYKIAGTRAGNDPRIVIIPEGSSNNYVTLFTNLGYSYSLSPTTSPTAAWLIANADIVIQDTGSVTTQMPAGEVAQFQTAYNSGVTFWFSVDDISSDAIVEPPMRTLCGISDFADTPDATAATFIFNKATYPNGAPTYVNGLSLVMGNTDEESVTVGTAIYLDTTNPGHYATFLDGGNKFVLYLGDTIISVTNLAATGTLGKLMDGFIKMWKISQFGDLILEDGEGASSKICYTKYKAYTFNATVTSQTTLANVSYVNMTLDYGPGEENIKYSWNASSDTFNEIYDPNDYAEISSNNTDSTNNSVDKWFLDFKINFNWSFPDEQLSDGLIELISKNDYDNASFTDLFRIENDMIFRGTLSVEAQTQGALSNGGWVIGSEQINWTGYRVTYQGSANAYVNGSYYNVSITDDDTGSWNGSPSTGENFSITTQADPVNDIADVHEIDIVDLPNGASDESKNNFTIRVDTINVTFANPVPYSGGWTTGFNPTCEITINDTDGSGVNVSSIEYRNSTNGPANYGPWLNANLTGSGTSYIAHANPSFIVGSNNYIQWRALDAVGNGFSNSTDIQVQVEMIPPDNSGASINIDSGAVYSNDTILDFVFAGFTDAGGSGLEGYYYAFDNNETTPNGTWDLDSPGQLTNATQGLVYVFVWARDFANNMGNSVNDSIFVDSKEPKLERITPTPDQWQNTATVACNVFVNDTLVGSGINVGSIEYRISTNGIGNYGNWLSAGATGSGTQIPVTVNPIFIEGTDNYIQWRANDIVDHQGISGHNQLKIDLTDIIYSNHQPSYWQTSSTVNCGINIDDTGGSGVDTNTIEYAISTTGISGYGLWQNLGKSGVVPSIYVTTTETFVEGTNNYIKWRASDLANNLLVSNDIQIMVDTINITFTDPIPIDNLIWQIDKTVSCGITVNDISGSMVNASAISYRYSTSGLGNYSDWISAQKTINGEVITCTANVNFYDGTDNYLKWGAKDVAGNWYESLDYNINVDTGNLTFSNALPQFYMWNLVTDVECSVNIKDAGPSGIDFDSVQYQISTSGSTGLGTWQTVDSNDISGTSSEVIVTVTPTFDEGKANYIRWRVADIAGNSRISNAYQILVDTDGIVFQDPLPLSVQGAGSGWEHALTVTCGITATDTASGVDAGSFEYSYSTTGTLPESFSDWIYVKEIKDSTSITGSVDINFKEGTENYILWRARDVAGNSYTLSDTYQLKIDTQAIAYTSVTPTNDEWQTEMPFEFKLTIEDNNQGSGINLSTIKYRISTKGIAGFSELEYGAWVVAETDPSTNLINSKDGLSSFCNVELTLPEGLSNHIKWYAEDYAGNGLESDDYQIIVDSNGPRFYEPSPESQKWQTGGELINCEVLVTDVGESQLDLETVEFSYSKTGLSGFGNWQDNWLKLAMTEDGTISGNTSSIDIVKLSTPTLKFQEGIGNYVKWRGYDNADNFQESEPYQIMIDTEELTYRNAKVMNQEKLENGDKVSFTFEITLDDTDGSGVDVSTIEFASSNDGVINFGDWKSLWAGTSASSIPAAQEYYAATITDTVEIGAGVIYIKVRAKDVAGNGYTESEASLILGNSVPTPLISSPKDGDQFYKGETINFDASNSFDDDEDQLEFTWTSNVSGELGKGAVVSTSLTPGQHRITLKISDGYNPEVTSSVTVTVSSESESEPGLFDDTASAAVVVALIVIIIIVIIIFFLITLRRKKLMAEEKEEPEGAPEALQEAAKQSPIPPLKAGLGPGEEEVTAAVPAPLQIPPPVDKPAELGQLPEEPITSPAPPPSSELGDEEAQPLSEEDEAPLEEEDSDSGSKPEVEEQPVPPKIKPKLKMGSPPKLKKPEVPEIKPKIKPKIKD